MTDTLTLRKPYAAPALESLDAIHLSTGCDDMDPEGSSPMGPPVVIDDEGCAIIGTTRICPV